MCEDEALGSYRSYSTEEICETITVRIPYRPVRRLGGTREETGRDP